VFLETDDIMWLQVVIEFLEGETVKKEPNTGFILRVLVSTVALKANLKTNFERQPRDDLYKHP